ncbi:MAG: outer membrane lipoprotein-sorting protein [Gammaproteobacteria bacterium]|nr:outer membrane lipoprotein-sorting protein [Gammaproteobacteria bacterium]
MSKLTSLLALTLVCLSHLCFAEELTLETLIRGVNQARLTIQSGEVRTIVTVKRAAQKTEKEIVEWKQTEIENELRNFRSHSLFPDVGSKEFKKDFLEPVFEFEADQYRQPIENENVTTIFRLLAPDTDLLLYKYKLTVQEVKGLSLDSESAQHIQDSNFFLLAHDSKKQVKQNIGDVVFATAPQNTVQFFSTDSEYGGFWNFDIFGRSSIPVGTDTQLIKKEQIDGAECYVLASTDASGWHGQIWVDTDKDFCIRKEEVRLGSDTLINRVFYKDFEKFGDIWFPKVREGIHYRKNGTVKTETRVEIIEVGLTQNYENS